VIVGKTKSETQSLGKRLKLELAGGNEKHTYHLRAFVPFLMFALFSPFRERTGYGYTCLLVKPKTLDSHRMTSNCYGLALIK